MLREESPKSWLASQPAATQRAFLRRLPTEHKRRLGYQWRGWSARPSQLAPPGDWREWLILAGRGFGKARAGAEWIREKVERNQARRIAIVGETEADARNVMVEGDSGLLRISPPDFKPVYEP